MKKRPAGSTESSGSDAVDAFMSKLQHPLKAQIETVRSVICGVGPSISEEIKWKSPGFRTTESFATVNLRSVEKLQLILHLGAKVRPGMKAFVIDDPDALVKWLGRDRCLVTIADISKERSSLAAIIRQWIKHV